MHQIRLLIMCEPPCVRRGLATIFASENGFKVMGEVGCSLDSVTAAQKIQPDAIIIEMNPENELKELLLQIKESCPYTKVLVFVNDDTASEALAAIDAGADGCLTKTMLPRNLVKAVELTCRAGVLCLPCFLKNQLSSQEKSVVQPDRLYNNDADSDELNGKCHLTPREMEIYKLIVQNYSNKEIGKKLFISQPTVKSHVSSILHKFGLGSRTQLVLFDAHKRRSSNGESENIIEFKQ